jgi:hypothetical protein
LSFSSSVCVLFLSFTHAYTVVGSVQLIQYVNK